MSVYITSGVDGVGAVPKENITCAFTPRGFDLKIKGLNGKNFRLLRSNLAGDIVPGESSYRAKDNRVTLVLKKRESGNWWKLEEDPKKAEMKSKDPGASIMDMMRDMYNDGDDNMKARAVCCSGCCLVWLWLFGVAVWL